MDQLKLFWERILAQVNLCCRMAPKKKKSSWSLKAWKSSYVAQSNKESHAAMFFHDLLQEVHLWYIPKKRDDHSVAKSYGPMES